MSEKVRVGISMSRNDYDELRRAAESEHLTLAALLRRAVATHRYIAARQRVGATILGGGRRGSARGGVSMSGESTCPGCVDTFAPCGSCGQWTTHRITLRGQKVPACLLHTNHWRTPPDDYTCPEACLFVNHPGREHRAWLAPAVA